MEKFNYSNENCVFNTIMTNLNLNSDFETFVYPDLDINGTTKISSGLTITSLGIYNITDNEINLVFNVTGNTQSFDKIQTFGYNIYKWEDSTTGFTKNIYNKEIEKTDFTGYTYNDTISIENLEYIPDSQYIINTYYIFSGTTEPYGLTQTYNTKEFELPNKEYINYSNNYSGYFAFYNNPPIQLNNIGEVKFFEGTYNNETLEVVVSGQTEFYLSKVPSKIINLNLNGLSLLWGEEIIGEVEYTNELNKIIIKSGLTQTNDIITIQYIADDNQPNFIVDSFYVSDLTDRVVLNTGTTKYEFLLENIPNGEITLIINGLKLNEGIDFYQSLTNSKILIFHEFSIEVGDTLIAIYESDGDVGNIYSSAVTINFQCTIEQENGEFLLEVTDFTDTNFLNPIFSATTDYTFNGEYITEKNNTYEYFLTFSPLQVGNTYLARIKNTKNINFVEFLIQPYSYSNIISFKPGDNSIESY